MRLEGIKETVLYANDLLKIREFYHHFLGLNIYSEKEDAFIFFKLSRQMLLFFQIDYSRSQDNLPAHFAEGVQHLAFWVPQEDYPRWKDKFEALEMVEHVQDWPDGLESFYFRDPENNSLEIVPENLWEK